MTFSLILLKTKLVGARLNYLNERQLGNPYFSYAVSLSELNAYFGAKDTLFCLEQRLWVHM